MNAIVEIRLPCLTLQAMGKSALVLVVTSAQFIGTWLRTRMYYSNERCAGNALCVAPAASLARMHLQSRNATEDRT